MRHSMKIRWEILVALAALGLMVPASALADSAQQILNQVKAVNDARKPKDSVQRGSMTIVDSGGASRTREIVTYSKNYDQDSSKSILFFVAPPDLKNVGVLTWEHPERDDDQWIYFPETERVRRLSSQIAKDNLGESDFSYEDSKLFEDLLRDWTKFGDATLVKEGDRIEDASCAVVDFSPKNQDIPYGRLRMWLDRAQSMLRRMELFDKDGSTLIKVLSVEDLRDESGVPTPHRLEMETVSRKTKTILRLSDVHYNTGLDDDLFTQRSLQRGPKS